MGDFPWAITLALIGTAVPILAFLWEFAIVGRKRLGYRVQMDTAVTDAAAAQNDGAGQQLRYEDGTRLADPSFVLLRFENNGVTSIDADDYAALGKSRAGIRVRFPGRRVAGMAVTELSDDELGRFFGEDSVLGVRDGDIELPRVPLNRSQHYKVLAVLDRAPQDAENLLEKLGPPTIFGGIKRTIGSTGIRRTKNLNRTSRPIIALIGLLVSVSLAQLAISLNRTATPLDCRAGRLSLTGSTAFAPVLREAADSYSGVCPGADFSLDAQGSGEGLRRLEQAGRSGGGSPALLAFSDGVNNQFPQLLPRPVAVSFFTLVVNPAAGVQDLSLSQIKRLYQGEVANWRQLDGNDIPVRLVGRSSDSSTRHIFETKVLGGSEPGGGSTDCRRSAPGAPPGARPGVTRCERDSTVQVLDEVARTPGAIGYSELGLASGHPNLRLVRIDGRAATLEAVAQRDYPFWETSYAYTYREPTADSLAASFLRYLTNEAGQDIIRSHGDRPCADLQDPLLCPPS